MAYPPSAQTLAPHVPRIVKLRMLQEPGSSILSSTDGEMEA